MFIPILPALLIPGIGDPPTVVNEIRFPLPSRKSPVSCKSPVTFSIAFTGFPDGSVVSVGIFPPIPTFCINVEPATAREENIDRPPCI